jgi:hypothetical protein
MTTEFLENWQRLAVKNSKCTRQANFFMKMAASGLLKQPATLD